MRTDVKLGVFFSMLIVLTLGGYFVYPRGGAEAIPLTGEVKPAGEKTVPTKLASNPSKATGRKKSPTAATSNKTVRNNPRTKAKTPTQRRTVPKKSTRHVGGATKKRNLPVSGASLGESARTARGKKAQPSNSAARNSLQAANARKNAALKTPKLKNVRKTTGPDRMASKLTEKPGTPTPPGLLASTRKRVAPKNEPAVDLHRVQPGDTFATLAKSYYGSAKYVDFLMKANPGVDPAKMQVGVTIRVPALSTQATATTTPVARNVKQTRTPSAKARTYTVRPGDSFYKIAKEQLGDASRWNELFEANKKLVGNDPARLKVGQVLTLPSK